MGWMGKLLGGSIGFALGGPLGAVIGAVLGHHTVDANEAVPGDSVLSTLEQKRTMYFVATFSMLGKLAKSDGVVTQHEIDVIDNVMRVHLKLTPDARRLAIEIFNEARDSSASFDEYASQFYDHFHTNQQMLVTMVELLLLVAMSDTQFHHQEKQLIESVVRMFHLQDHYEQIRSRFNGVPDDINRYYHILGCEVGDSIESVKKKYRKLAMEFHPDRVQANGMPEEFAEVAQDKFKEIQHAYDLVSKDLGK
jgi:DnaJ like chaperone protein